MANQTIELAPEGPQRATTEHPAVATGFDGSNLFETAFAVPDSSSGTGRHLQSQEIISPSRPAKRSSVSAGMIGLMLVGALSGLVYLLTDDPVTVSVALEGDAVTTDEAIIEPDNLQRVDFDPDSPPTTIESISPIADSQVTSTQVTDDDQEDPEKPDTKPDSDNKPKPKPQPKPQPRPQPGNSGQTVWVENFDRLDRSRWEIMNDSKYGYTNNEVQCYMKNNVWTSNGNLVIRARKEYKWCEGVNRYYTSAMIISKDAVLRPGQSIEFRVKLNPSNKYRQSGLWPAVWASSWAEGGWPKGGELDFLEVMTAEDPNRAMFSIHYQNPSRRHALNNKPYKLDSRFSDKWRTIRFDYGWGGKLTWHIDGKKAHYVNWANTRQGWPAPFDQPVRRIKVNLALGGDPGPLDDRALSGSGATFEVDYIRIFKS